MIRPATPGDIAALLSLWSWWAAAEGHADPDTKAWAEQEYAGLAAGSVIATIAIVKGVPVGFTDATLAYEPATREHVMVGRHLFLMLEQRGSSLGQRLTLLLLAIGRQSGAQSLITHGTPSAHTMEKLLGKPMKMYHETRIVRL